MLAEVRATRPKRSSILNQRLEQVSNRFRLRFSFTILLDTFEPGRCEYTAIGSAQLYHQRHSENPPLELEKSQIRMCRNHHRCQRFERDLRSACRPPWHLVGCRHRRSRCNDFFTGSRRIPSQSLAQYCEERLATASLRRPADCRCLQRRTDRYLTQLLRGRRVSVIYRPPAEMITCAVGVAWSGYSHEMVQSLSWSQYP